MANLGLSVLDTGAEPISSREQQLETALGDARKFLDDQLSVEIDSNTTKVGKQTSREEKRAACIIDEYGGRDIPVLETLIAKIDAALAA